MTRNLWLQFDQLQLNNGVLMRLAPRPRPIQDVLQLVVPCQLQKEVLESLHNSVCGAHLGVKRTVGKVKSQFYWLGFKVSSM